MQARIGQDLVRRLPRENKDIRDTKVIGFVVRCRASGKHSYLVQLRRGRWMTLGKVGTLEPHEARELARKALLAVANGEDPTDDKRNSALTWGQYLEQEFGPWVREHRKTGAEITARLKNQFSAWDTTPLTQLSGFAVERWRTTRLKSGVTSATVNRDLSNLRGALSRACEWKLLKTHPMEDVKASKENTAGHVRYLTDEEEKRLTTALANRDERRTQERDRANEWRRARGYREWPVYGRYSDHLTPIVLTALHTGCRRGELFALRWQDVDLVEARLRVRAENAKSSESRVIPLNTDVVDVLKAWRPAEAKPTALVFPGYEGKALDNIQTSWERTLEAAEITAFRFHDCRHTFASRLVMAGVDLNTVRELLGHGDIKMTLRYAHLAPEHKAAAVAKLVRSS